MSTRYSYVNKTDKRGKFVTDKSSTLFDSFMNFIYSKLRSFHLNGEKYGYFYHSYNTTWKNERAVEIPIIMKILKQRQGEKILEVGNVISHYFNIPHMVIDKYEKRKGIINMDVVNLELGNENKFNLIFSISTIEHIGWDEETKDSKKIPKVISILKSALRPGGQLIITFPVGHNPYLDQLVKTGKIKFDKLLCMKRISKTLNRWKEASWEEIKDHHYNSPYQNGNGLVIGYFYK